MKKFGKSYIKKEKRNQRIEDSNDDFLNSIIRRKIDHLNIYNISDEEYYGDRLAISALYRYSEMPNKFQKWYDKEILKNYNNVELLTTALKELTYQTYNRNNKEKNCIMNSLKLTKLVEDISFYPREKKYTIKTKSGKYNLYPIAKTYGEAMENLGYCHPLTEEYARNNKGIDIVCGYYEDSLYNDRYHSVAINNKTKEVRLASVYRDT